MVKRTGVQVTVFAAFALAANVMTATAAGVGLVSVPCEGEAPAQQQSKTLALSGGIDASRAWLTSEREGLKLRKFTSKHGESVVELAYRGDQVVLQLAAGLVRVTRNNRSIDVVDAAALESVQSLLGGSAAIFHAKAMLSEFETQSRLTPGEMSLLSALAFAAALTGDFGAPARLAERFQFVHRGVVRQVGLAAEASCWSNYEGEVNAAWNDMQQCMSDTDDSGWFGSVVRLACNATWLLRGESAWFEYLKCLSPLASIAKLP